MKLRKDRLKLRQEEATERANAYAKLTPAQKIAKLDELYGKGIGAKKQRGKLQIALEKTPAPKVIEKTEKTEAPKKETAKKIKGKKNYKK